MFKINRFGTNGRCNKGLPTASINKRISVSNNKKILNRSLSDFNKLNKKITIEKINSFKRLTKENIKQLNLRKSIAQNSFRFNKKQVSLEQQINKQTKNQNNISELPKIPEYKAQQNNKDIQQLPVRKIQTQEDMAKIFNSIMNGNDMQQLSKPKQKQNNSNDNKNMSQSINDIKNKQINYDKIIDNLKKEILDQKNINYMTYIQIAINLRKKFPKNNMIKSIILKAIDRHNRQQYYKIPDDKLKDLIDIILSNIQN